MYILVVHRHQGRIIYLEYNGEDVKNTFMFVGKVGIMLHEINLVIPCERNAKEDWTNKCVKIRESSGNCCTRTVFRFFVFLSAISRVFVYLKK